MANKLRTSITYGTFDMFHVGHLNLFKKIRDFSDRLIVGVSTDEFNEAKGKRSLIPYEQRAAIVSAIKYVDQVIPEESWEQKIRDVQQHRVDVFAIGEDWKGQFDFLRDYCQVVYLERTSGVSSSELKRSLASALSVSRADLMRAFGILEQLKRDLE